MTNLKLTLPKSENAVMKLIHKYHQAKKDDLTRIFQESDKKFSLTLDEWTSTKNRRYMNINLHDSEGKTYNLGLVRILGSCTSEKILNMVNERLLNFGLNLEDHIVGATSDGAAVMVKFGRLAPSICQLCLNHAMHISVTKTIYNEQEICPEPSIAEKSGEYCKNLI